LQQQIATTVLPFEGTGVFAPVFFYLCHCKLCFPLYFYYFRSYLLLRSTAFYSLIMAQKAHITVYLQAQGAHYLGAHAYHVQDIRVKLVYSGGSKVLPYNVTANFTDDGNPSATFTAGASSFMPIITVPASPAQQNASVHFLSPDFSTACARGDFELPAAIEFGHLEISVPTTTNVPMILRHPVLLNPAQPAYAITVVVPGLYLTPQKTKGAVSVLVKMMCGCPVTVGPPASLWPAADFTVYANVLDTSGKTTAYALSYDAAQTGNSLFSAPFVPGQKPVKSITFTAIQKSTGNYGAVIQS
jgi:hypothetical protein